MTTQATQPVSPIREHQPMAQFLDRLPTALYVMAHAIFLAAAVGLWLRAGGASLPYARPIFALYGASQLGFFAYFAGRITMKAAVLAEQTLVFALIVLVALAA
jgi:hypothetical protein